ncbi:DUF2510 domain-containing protein [Actinomarinicola tropica]|uniref:DUF2510 domain-containing protein n=1 Tax=Actinomarinicola tropica TaxID=2789776 RepID=UPI001E61E948|nr:DUF2510 domain-containing protein [Actinomarinicola tropica]
MSEQSGSWQPDPFGRHQYRWWNGAEWTDQVSNDGNVSSDPPEAGGAAGGETTSETPATSEGPVAQDPEPTQTGPGWGQDATTSMPAAGATYESTTTTTPATDAPKKSSSNVPALVIGGILLLALIGAGAYLLFSGGDDERSREDLIAAVRDDLDLSGSEASCVVDEVGEERLDGILDAGSDVSDGDRDALNAAVGECTGAGEETTDTTEDTTETTETTEDDDTDTDTDVDELPDPFVDAFVETMMSELDLTEAQASCFAEEFFAIEGLDIQGMSEDPDAAMSDPALFSAMFDIFETCDIDPMSLSGGAGGSGGTGEDGELSGILEGQTYGDNPILDELWDECEDGDLEACNDLYMHSEFGSEYEAFGLNDGELP